MTTDNRAYCWGGNTFGQLGDGTTSNCSTPVAVSGGFQFKAVATGGQHTCGVTPSDRAYCWGWNFDGRLGDGTTTTRLRPVPVAGSDT